MTMILSTISSAHLRNQLRLRSLLPLDGVPLSCTQAMTAILVVKMIRTALRPGPDAGLTEAATPVSGKSEP